MSSNGKYHGRVNKIDKQLKKNEQSKLTIKELKLPTITSVVANG